MKDDHLDICPECSGPVKRLIGMGAGLIFKGSGFYLTDYRSDSYKKQAKKESEKPKSESKKGKESQKPAAGEKKKDKGGT